MTQEYKDLLLKDLCGRLPYGVKLYCTQGTSIDRKKGWKLVGYQEANNEIKDVFNITVGTRRRIILNCVGPNNNVDIDFINDEVKPYLFPLSSMTPEQRTIYNFLSNSGHRSFTGLIDFYHKNHLDWRGLIPKDLAIDCTDLNIY